MTRNVSDDPSNTDKSAIVDGDRFPVIDSETSPNSLKEVTKSNLRKNLFASPAQGDILYRSATDWVRLPAGTAGQFLQTLGGSANPQWANGPSNSICDGRLTLATGVPVTTTDQLAKTTIYFTPYIGNRIALFDGVATWNIRTFAEPSVAVPATTVTPFDIFVYDNAGTPTLETTNWTNDTTRATALTYQDGVLVKTGATTRRYLGTGRTTGSSGQIESSTSKRFLWNYYNRVLRHLSCIDTTDSWNYTTATWRAANANTTAGQGRVEIVIGVAEDVIRAVHQGICFNANSPLVATGIALDATNTNHAQVYGGYANANGVNIPAHFEGIPSAGYHFVQRTEISTASGTTTWSGDGGGTIVQSGMIVDLLG